MVGCGSTKANFSLRLFGPSTHPVDCRCDFAVKEVRRKRYEAFSRQTVAKTLKEIVQTPPGMQHQQTRILPGTRQDEILINDQTAYPPSICQSTSAVMG